MKSTTIICIFIINLQFIFCIIFLYLSDYFADPVLEAYLKTLVLTVSSDKEMLYTEIISERFLPLKTEKAEEGKQ